MLSCLSPLLAGLVACVAAELERPNIVYILTDDQGYGDVSCLNPQGSIPTPHIDRLAREGMLFTDAHSGSSVCTPTRYGLLTGRYAWRSPLKSGVLGGLSPPLIEPGRLTVATMLGDQGYHTACIGKWHLGMDWVVKEGRTVHALGIESPDQVWNVDFTQPIRNGPNHFGFDYFFGISASLDMVPYAYLENDRLTQAPERDGDFPWFLGRERRTRRGPVAEGFDAADVLGEFTRRAIRHIGERAAESREGKPFFLYLALASPHTPILPTPDWQGKSGVNAYADFTMETDARVGQILQALDDHGLTDNTMVLFATDNGCSPEADLPELAAAGHHPSGPFRGHKADLFEGGHRVPFVVRWPGRVAAGLNYSHPVCLTDLLATCAELLGVELPDNAGEDSVSLLPALLGQTTKPLRDTTVHHSINGSFAIRQDRWKLLLCPDSGGWSYPRPGSAEAAELPPVQLYDLVSDPGERNNLQAQHPGVVRKLVAQLEQVVREGRSTPGAAQSNHGKVDIWRGRPAFKPIGSPNLNVLFIAIDDLRNELGALGVPHAQTPHLDSFAATARLFSHHYTQVPTCGASRASLLRGRYPSQPAHLANHAIATTHESWGDANLPAWFQRHGYRTLALGKITHHPGGRTGRNWAEGPEELPGAWTRTWIPESPWPHAEAMMHGFANGHPRVRGESPPWEAFEGPDEAYPDAWIAAEAIDTLKQLAVHDGPWFFGVGFFKPHLPFAAPRHYFEQHDPNRIPALPPAVAARRDWPSGWHGSGEFRGNYGHDGRDPETDPDYARLLRHAYAASVSYVDAQVGRVLTALRELELDQDTIVIVWSDHGFLLGEHAIWGKHCLYEQALRAPLIIRHPGLPLPGQTSAALVETVDLFPTLAELCNLPVPSGLDGRSLLPQLRDPTAPGVKPALGFWTNGQRTIRTERWRLIVQINDEGQPARMELFDYETDPGETHNHALDQPAIASALRDLLDRIPSPTTAP
jgi:arylsulfatase A